MALRGLSPLLLLLGLLVENKSPLEELEGQLFSLVSILLLSQVTKLGPLQALTEPLKLEVLVVDDGRDHPLVVLEVEDEELKLFTVKLA